MKNCSRCHDNERVTTSYNFLILNASNSFSAFMRISTMLVLAVYVCGCACNTSYHAERKTVREISCVEAAPKLSHSFKLAFIEFDDQGEFFNERQLDQTLTEIKLNRKNLILITFVHGWQNNASINGNNNPLMKDADMEKSLKQFNEGAKGTKGDVQRFKQFLALIANSPSVVNSGKHVMGVYLGWRGELISKGPDPITDRVVMSAPRALTFWSRRAAATRMGDASEMGFTLDCLRAAAKPVGSRATREDPITVFMGHSFGGKVLEQAVCQWLARKYAEIYVAPLKASSGQAEKFADLVLIMNPASEAIYARRIVEMMRRLRAASGDSKARDTTEISPPWLVTVTSKTDSATNNFFNVGTRVGTVFGGYRDYDDKTHQRDFFCKTAPNVKQLKNGDAVWCKDLRWEKSASGKAFVIQPYTESQEKKDKSAESVARAETTPSLITAFDLNLCCPNSPETSTYLALANNQVGKLQINTQETESPNRANDTHYWILKVDPKIMDGHSDIWGPNAMNLYARLFHYSAGDRVSQTGTSVLR